MLTKLVIVAMMAGAILAGSMVDEGLADEPRSGGTVVVLSNQVPRHLNPAVQAGVATALPGAQLFASLLRYDENWDPEPYLAERWDISPDGTEVTVHLVKGATFHDGTPITSDDVKFSIETVKANHPFQSMFAPVMAVETPDPHTAIIRLRKPHPAILLAMSPALLPIIPEHIYGDGQDVRTHPANAAPVGSGPFKFVEFEPGQQITLERYDDFFIEGRPYLDRIIIRTVRDSNALLIAMEAGEADMYPLINSVFEVRRLERAERLQVTDLGHEAIGPINWLAFNMSKAPIDDARVRRAIAFAVDREFVTQTLHRGVSEPQIGPIVSSSPFFHDGIQPYDLDLERANDLLDEAGYPPDADGMRFELTIDYLPGVDEQQKNVAEYLRSQLRKIGIAVTVRSAPDFPTWAQRVANGDFDLTMDVVFNWGDPVIGVHRSYLSSNIRPGVIWSNTQGYANPRVDELLNAAAEETDIGARKALYREFQSIVAEDLPVYWINTVPNYTAYDSRLANIPLGIWGVLQPMDEVHWQ